MLVSAPTPTPTHSRTSFSASLGTAKGCGKDRQEPLSGASEGGDLFLGGVEGLSAARVSSIANLQGVTSGLDWYLDRVVHFDRPGPLAVDHDIVRATERAALPGLFAGHYGPRSIMRSTSDIPPGRALAD
jgi:hypothetical protein